MDRTTKLTYRSLKKKRQVKRDVYKPILIIKTDSEVLEAKYPGRRPKRNAKLPRRFKNY
jgi:hypothetical protein